LIDELTCRGQGTGDREQGTGDREQGTGNRGQGTGNREQGTGNREQGTGDRNYTELCKRKRRLRQQKSNSNPIYQGKY